MASFEDRSYWNATAPGEAFPSFAGELHVDLAIIGGGIVGITAARAAKDLGLTAAVVEARRVGRQASGRSTAKLTSQHGLVYHALIGSFGEERARLYARAQEDGIRQIRQYSEQYGIDCDLEPKSAYAYTCDPSCLDKIEREVGAAQRLGLPARLVQQADLPFQTLAAVCFDDQMQFHPTRYVAGLARSIPGDGSFVFEHSRAVDWQPDRVVTDQGMILARHVAMATHLPLGQVGGYYAEAYPYAEPVIAARIKTAPDGMFINVEQPSRSIRTHRADNGEIYAIAAGSKFKPGHTQEERDHFAEIEDWLKTHFDPDPIAYRWVNEDYTSMDKAPFVGWSSSGSQAYLVATGFDAWGLSNGTAAGLLLADLAAGRDNPWLEMFDATRIRPLAGGKKFVKETAAVAAHLAGGYLGRRSGSPEDLHPGEAAVMTVDGHRIAAFRDEKGQLHQVSAVCTHMGCILGWNQTDRSWDCPCHGSRFGPDGEVIHGPATRPLGSKLTG